MRFEFSSFFGAGRGSRGVPTTEGGVLSIAWVFVHFDRNMDFVWEWCIFSISDLCLLLKELTFSQFFPSPSDFLTDGIPEGFSAGG